jgi:hypothetical protein
MKTSGNFIFTSKDIESKYWRIIVVVWKYAAMHHPDPFDTQVVLDQPGYEKGNETGSMTCSPVSLRCDSKRF